MPNKRNYHKSHLYYPDDKDIRDFLRSTGVSDRKSRAFLSSRGQFLPKSHSLDELHKAISRLIISWNGLEDLVGLAEVSDKQEKTTFEDISFDGDINLVKDAFEKVRDERSTKEKESYEVRCNNGKIEVTVEYVEIDNSRTPMLQGRPAQLSIQVSQDSGSLRVTHTSNDVSKDIMDRFKSELEALAKQSNPELVSLSTSSISLSDCLVPSLRVEFFKQLCGSLEGFEYQKATNVKVSRFPTSLANGVSKADSNDGEEDEDADGLTAEKKEEILRGAILQGLDVEQSEHYKALLEAGFFVSQLTWDSVEATSRDLVSFTAGFKKAEEARDFEFKVNHRTYFDGGEWKGREKLPPATLDDFRRRICTAAISASRKIKDLTAKVDIGPSAKEKP